MVVVVNRLTIVLAMISALWLGPGRAIISWDGPGCVYRNTVLLLCDNRDVAHLLYLGGPLTDGAYRPAAGDVYTLIKPRGGREQAWLVSRLYFPLWK